MPFRGKFTKRGISSKFSCAHNIKGLPNLFLGYSRLRGKNGVPKILLCFSDNGDLLMFGVAVILTVSNLNSLSRI